MQLNQSSVGRAGRYGLNKWVSRRQVLQKETGLKQKSTVQGFCIALSTVSAQKASRLLLSIRPQSRNESPLLSYRQKVAKRTCFQVYRYTVQPSSRYVRYRTETLSCQLRQCRRAGLPAATRSMETQREIHTSQSEYRSFAPRELNYHEFD